MEILQAIILGLVQGFTEFIPVSSSGHLILVGHVIDFQYSGLVFDTSLALGTLAALLLVFWRDFWNLAHDLVVGGPQRKLAAYILIATLPAVVIGMLVQDAAETVFRSDLLVAFNLLWVAALMLIIDRGEQIIKKVTEISLFQSILVGFAQALALIPGTSRSGITIVTGRALGLDRVTATRFSFLLSAPVIAGATMKLVLSDQTLGSMGDMPLLYAAGILSSFVAGYISIKFMLQYLSKHGLSIFAYYRIALGVIILIMAGAA